MTRATANFLRAFALWTIWVWSVRIVNIVGDAEHEFAFKAVHSALAGVSVVGALITLGLVSRSRSPKRAVKTPSTDASSPDLESVGSRAAG